jgi:sialate O-acetylesterase
MMAIMLPRLVCGSLLLALATGLGAQARLHPLFQDHMVLQRDQQVPVWGEAAPGEQVTVEFAGQKLTTKAGADGRWSVALAPLKVGKPRRLVVTASNRLVLEDVLVGEVWLCSGQSNMAWPLPRARNAKAEIAAASHPQIRLFQVPRLVSKVPVDRPKGGTWRVCSPEHARSFSAVAYFFGRHLHQQLDVPIGLVQSAVGGTPAEAWTSSKGLDDPEFASIRARWQKADADFPRFQQKLKAWQEAAAKAKQAGEKPPPRPRGTNPMRTHRASGLYNGMIAPLLPFAIRGAIWYQGEANVGRAYQYRKLFPAMIRDWRRAFAQPDLPFFWVQLAPFRYGRHDRRACAELWEAQSMALSLPHTGMAVALDLGNPRNIHPANKQDVGRRLGLCAEALVYGRDVQYSGPVFAKLRVDGGKAVLLFDQVGKGLMAKDGTLEGFQVAGKDKTFHPGTAVVHGDTVVVTSDAVARPLAVRYAWHDTATASLYNKDGLPASPFRTDDWPGVTVGKR